MAIDNSSLSLATGEHTLPGDLLTRAESLSSVVEDTALESERIGTLAPAMVQALRDSELFGIMVPTELGGHGADILCFVEVLEELSRADASTGWAYMANAATSATFSSTLSDDAVKKIFGGDEWPITAGMLGPAGTAAKVPGGYILNGKFAYASGSGHADWIGSGGACTVDGKAQPVVCVLPRDKVELLGNWDVLGLGATGSYDYRVDHQFVAEDFTFLRLRPPTRRGQASLRLGPIFIGVAGHLGVALGTAKRALAELVKLVDTGKARVDAVPIRDQPLFHRDFAMLEAKYRSSRSYAMESLSDALNAVRAGEELTTLHEQRFRHASTFAVDAAMEVVAGCYRWSGGAGLRNPHPLGRCLRDMSAQTQHVLVDMNTLAGAGPALLDSYRH